MSESQDKYFYYPLPTVVVVTGISVSLFLYMVVLHFFSAPLAFFSLLSLGSTFVVCGLLWSFRRKLILYVFLIIMAALHVLALWLLPPLGKVSFGIMFAPAVVLDMYIFWYAISSLLKMLSGGTD